MKDILVGINYFAGWWEPLPNKWHKHKSSFDTECGEDWQEEFPDRVPLLGCYNDQETMNKEIVAAADNGVNFFAILWYKCNPKEPNSQFLNNGTKCFIASPNAKRMNFYIEFVNHPPCEVRTEQEWQECLAAWSDMFKHPSYLKIGNRLVFKIHGAGHFMDQNDKDIARCKAQIKSLRETARKATGLEMIIGGGVMAQGVAAGNPVTELFDFTCTYGDIPPLVQRKENYPYEILADVGRAARFNHCRDPIAYMPYLMAGWNPGPWPDNRAYFELPTREQWSLELKRMKEDLLVYPNMGLPLPDGTLQPAFTCYAWNEFGEGGFIAPTQGDQYMKLEEIKKYFG